MGSFVTTLEVMKCFREDFTGERAELEYFRIQLDVTPWG